MIRVITGPPAAGKSTYVELNSHPGDIIIDMDKIAAALWKPDTSELHDYPDDVRRIAMSARNAAVRKALDAAQGERYLTVWIIHSDPNAETRALYRAAGGKFTHLDPGMEVCLQRVKERGPRVSRSMEPVIRNFYARQGVR